jgi:hypothetical protein
MTPDIRKSTALFEGRNSIKMTAGVENLCNILTGETRARDKPAPCHCVRREKLATGRLSHGTATEFYVYQNAIKFISSLTLHNNHPHCREQGVNNIEGSSR